MSREKTQAYIEEFRREAVKRSEVWRYSSQNGERVVCKRPGNR